MGTIRKVSFGVQIIFGFLALVSPVCGDQTPVTMGCWELTHGYLTGLSFMFLFILVAAYTDILFPEAPHTA